MGSYAEFNAYAHTHPHVLRPCQPPRQGHPCDRCILHPPSAGGKRTDPSRLSVDRVAEILALAGKARPRLVTERVGYCAVLLDTPGHKFKRGGEGNGCKRCGTLPSHVIHWNSAYWEGERYFYGFS